MCDEARHWNRVEPLCILGIQLAGHAAQTHDPVQCNEQNKTKRKRTREFVPASDMTRQMHQTTNIEACTTHRRTNGSLGYHSLDGPCRWYLQRGVVFRQLIDLRSKYSHENIMIKQTRMHSNKENTSAHFTRKPTPRYNTQTEWRHPEHPDELAAS